jgi:hypothetical protein
MMGEDSSGEVECVLHAVNGDLLVGVGSDHTDRKAETIGVSLSKQMCAKPISRWVWRFADVASHWDRLMLRSFVHSHGSRRLYQEGTLASLRPPEELVRLFTGGGSLPPGSSMFCGTVETRGAIEPAEAFEMELEDPVLGRKLSHSYRINTLPDQG